MRISISIGRSRPTLRVLDRVPASVVIGGFLLLAVLLIVAAGPLFVTGSALTMSNDTLMPPDSLHPLGTDDLGRDLLGRLVEGGRVSLAVGLFSAVLGTSLGMSIGMIAGFFGGAIDEALMRITEGFQVLPRLIVAIVVVALFGSSLLHVVIVIGCLSWPTTARIIRARVLVIRNEEFIAAAQLSGASWLRILVKQVAPNILPYFLVSSSLQVASAILSESFLSFLGLGDPDRASWGLLLHQGQLFMEQAWWLTTFPGIALAVTILALNLIGDGLGAALNMRRLGH